MKHLASALLITGGLLAAPSTMAASLVGLWDFNNPGNVGQATVGADLTVVGTAPVQSANLGGETGVITTADALPTNNLTLTNPIGANGGGAFTNQWSLLFDVLSPVASQSSWRTFFQTNPANTNDGDLFIRNNNQQLGFADLGYSNDNFPEAQWTRLIITINNGSMISYTDGSLFFTHPNNLGVDSRLSLDTTLLLVGDDDGDNAPLNIGTVAFWDGVLTPGEISALGGAGRPVPEPGVVALALAAVGFGLRRRRR